MKVIYQKGSTIKGDIKELVPQPIVIRIGDITEKTARDFSALMSEAYNTGQPVIPVIVDSFGGDVYALLAILSDIESSRLPVATICIGKAMSAGAVLLAHGTPGMRFMDPNATVMIHEAGSSAWWNKLSELKTNVEELNRLNQLIYIKMALACGHKNKEYFLKQIEKMKNVDWYLDCMECKKHKVVDHFGIPELHIKLENTVDFVYAKPKIEKH